MMGDEVVSMNAEKPLRYSVLDLAPVVAGGSAGESFRNTLDLARHAERLGYHRYWLAEHHNIPGIASAATSVVIGYVAGGTSTIRVGSGGIMLPNHAPLVIAEQFGTLESLYPGRIDLGLGRAPGGGMRGAGALRRVLGGNGGTVAAGRGHADGAGAATVPGEQWGYVSGGSGGADVVFPGDGGGGAGDPGAGVECPVVFAGVE